LSQCAAVPRRRGAIFAQVTDCAFCAILAGDAPAQFVLDEPEVAAFLDVRPLFKGHVLVLPRAHYETLADLPARLLGPLFGDVQRISAAMPAAYGAQGSFVAINNTVSQSVPHLHVHVVPRTKGDGLRGFFWPRGRYASDDEAAQYARRMREALAGSVHGGDDQARGDGDLGDRAEHVTGDPAQAADGEPRQRQ
jgi:histidine triad (HIT) family protein